MTASRTAAPDWYPDWRGQPCVIVAAGPSAKEPEIAALRGRVRVVVLNRSFELAPWADALYACDFNFWREYPEAQRFAGLKISQDERTQAFAHIVPLAKTKDAIRHEIVADLTVIGGGNTSGFQALNLVNHFGANPIGLYAFDYSTKNGVHWHGPHSGKCSNPDENLLSNAAGYLDNQAARLAAMGVGVVNLTADSALRAFPFMTVDAFLGVAAGLEG